MSALADSTLDEFSFPLLVSNPLAVCKIFENKALVLLLEFLFGDKIGRIICGLETLKNSWLR